MTVAVAPGESYALLHIKDSNKSTVVRVTARVKATLLLCSLGLWVLAAAIWKGQLP